MQKVEPQHKDIDDNLFNAMFLVRSVDLKPVFLTDLKKIPMFVIPLYRPDGDIVVLEAHGVYATPLSKYVTSLLGGAANRFLVLSSLDNDTQEMFVHLKLVLCPSAVGKTRGRLLVRGKEEPMNFKQLKVQKWVDALVMVYNGEVVRPYQSWFLTIAEEDQLKKPLVDPFEAFVTSLTQCSPILTGNEFMSVQLLPFCI